MIKIFKIDELGRKMNCECGAKLDRGKQIKIISSASRFGVNYKYICPKCADIELGKINTKLDELKRSV